MLILQKSSGQDSADHESKGRPTSSPSPGPLHQELPLGGGNINRNKRTVLWNFWRHRC